MGAQKWLEKYYPDKETTYSIYINQQLEGVVDCSEYWKLEKIFISTQVDSSKLEIKKGSYKKYGSDKTKKTQITPCILAQDYLNQNYPKGGTCIRENESKYYINNFGKKREQITKLDMSEQDLEGDLNLSDFTNLEELYCSDNYLTQITYPTNPENITWLDIRNNNLSLSLSFRPYYF